MSSTKHHGHLYSNCENLLYFDCVKHKDLSKVLAHHPSPNVDNIGSFMLFSNEEQSCNKEDGDPVKAKEEAEIHWRGLLNAIPNFLQAHKYDEFAISMHLAIPDLSEVVEHVGSRLVAITPSAANFLSGNQFFPVMSEFCDTAERFEVCDTGVLGETHSALDVPSFIFLLHILCYGSAVALVRKTQQEETEYINKVLKSLESENATIKKHLRVLEENQHKILDEIKKINLRK